MTARRQLLPLAVLAVAAAVMFARIRHINGGTFSYSMDDPYIHLALATQIASGHYGLNSSEFAAPSSSVIWPFLLVPLSVLRVEEYAPLVINLLAATATLLVLWSLLDRAYGKRPGGKSAVPILVIALIPCTNLLGLVFSGMEHSLQVWLSVVMLLGVISEQRDTSPSWWLWAAIVAGPLVRYECLALSLPSLAYLWLRGHRRAAVTTAVVLAAFLGAFSLFLHHLGLGVLPTSVQAKGLVVPGAIGTHGLGVNLWINFFTRQGIALLASALLLMAVAASRSRSVGDRALAGIVVVAVALHMGFGQFGWQDRYEIYIRLVALLAVLWVLRHDVGSPVVMIGLLLYVLIGGMGYAKTSWETPASANAIYRQQYQMHRFAVEYYRGPVASDDLGWMSYRNPYQVLDLYGLGSPAALRCRDHRCEPGWMDRMARERGVQLAMILAYQFPDVPTHWIRVGELVLSGRESSDGVSFFVLDAANRSRVEHLLTEFRQTLPPGVRFVFDNEERTASAGSS